MQIKHHRLFKLAAVPAFLLSSYAYGSGIQLDTSYSSAGYAWAGRAALHDDASTGYYNPALYSTFKCPQVGLSGIFAEFNPDAKLLDASITLPGPVTVPTTGNDRASIGGWKELVGLHAALPLAYNFSAGLNVAMPWGLSVDYTRSAKTRYFGTYASLQVVDIVPGLSYEIIDGLSVGLALDALYSRAANNQVFPSPAADIFVKNRDGETWNFGWNAGAYYTYAPYGTQVGVGFHSQVDITTEGNSLVTDATGAEFAGDVETDLIYPAFFNVSVVQKIDDCWSILADIRWTNWNKVDKNVIKVKGAAATALAADGIDPTTNLVLDWRDSLNYALGVAYKHSEQWTFKAGIGYDETPVPNSEKRPYLIPDNDRYIGAFGAQYCINQYLHLDASYTAKVLPTAHIHATEIAPPIELNSDARVNTWINEFSVAITWTIA